RGGDDAGRDDGPTAAGAPGRNILPERGYAATGSAGGLKHTSNMKSLAPLLVSLAVAVAAITAFLAWVQEASAGGAPFPAQAGTSLGAASQTDIRMVSETVVLAVSDIVWTRNNDPTDVYTATGALVTADFLLNNPGASAQSLKVGFPHDIPSQASG